MEHRLKRLSAGVLAVVPALTITVTAAPSQAAATGPRSCVAHRLPAPSRQSTGEVQSGSPDGRYLIGDGEKGFLVWHNRKVAAVPKGTAIPLAVNNHGTVVGYLGGSKPRPGVLRGNTMTPLKGVAGGKALGINASGVIVGTGNRPLDPSAVARWSSAAAKPVMLAVPRAYPYVLDLAIADDGTVIATLLNNPRPGQPTLSATYAWPPHGAAYRMPEPTVHGRKQSGAGVVGVNGDLVTWQLTVAGEHRGRTFRYDLRTRRFQSLPATVAVAEAVNIRGWVAGDLYNGWGKAVLQTPDRTIALTPGWADGSRVAVLSDDGRMVAGTANIGGTAGESFPLVWDCR